MPCVLLLRGVGVVVRVTVLLLLPLRMVVIVVCVGPVVGAVARIVLQLVPACSTAIVVVVAVAVSIVAGSSSAREGWCRRPLCRCRGLQSRCNKTMRGACGTHEPVHTHVTAPPVGTHRRSYWRGRGRQASGRGCGGSGRRSGGIPRALQLLELCEQLLLGELPRFELLDQRRDLCSLIAHDALVPRGQTCVVEVGPRRNGHATDRSRNRGGRKMR